VPGINDPIALFSGGSHDGETTTVAAGVTRLVTSSAAPGLVDVYEQTDEMREVEGNSEPAIVFAFAGQEPAAERVPMDALPEPPET
jgi:hypothetical protein